MAKIVFKTKNTAFTGLLNNSQAALEILANLPVDSSVSKWGKEIYFDLGFKASSAEATVEVEPGDIAYWPQGKSLCVFYGPTPPSEEEAKPVPASSVVIVGKTLAGAGQLDKIKLGDRIRVERVQEG